MRKKMLWLGVMAALVAVPSAFADFFTFNADYCSNPCLGGVPASNNGGTVTLTQMGSGIVDVVVALAAGLHFHDQGLESFAFNITGNPALTLTTGALAAGNIKVISGGGGTWTTFDQPAGNTDGAGSTFGYALDCTAGAGSCAGSPSTLEFEVDSSGLTPLSFETRTGSSGTTNVDFAANVSAGGGACTGMVGAGNGTNQSTPVTTNKSTTICSGGVISGGGGTVPEPSSIILFGTVLVGITAFWRKKVQRTA
jgi:hypothetical protein